MSVAKAKKSNFLEIASNILQVCVHIVVIIGTGFAAYQYSWHKESARLQNTFDYIKSYEQESVQEARENIRNELRGYESTFSKKKMTQEIKKQTILILATGQAGSAPLESYLDRIVDFFEGLSMCLHTGHCEKELAREYFSCKASYYWQYFEPYFKHRRIDNGNFHYAQELMCFHLGNLTEDCFKNKSGFEKFNSSPNCPWTQPPQ